MYDELVKRLRETPFDIRCVNLMKEAAGAIEDLEFACNRYEKDYKDLCAYLPKWIPVTERLPENVRDVQITVFWHDAWRTMYGYYDGSFWHLYAPMHTEVADVEVIGWMEKPAPMPTPPKEEENVSVD